MTGIPQGWVEFNTFTDDLDHSSGHSLSKSERQQTAVNSQYAGGEDCHQRALKKKERMR